MNKTQVTALLKANRNDRGIEHWKRIGPSDGRLKSFGIGLTSLRKLAKQIGRDHALALELWESDNYDARTIALLIDDPKQITREQAEKQVEELEHGMLAHVFCSCDATLAKTPFVVELSGDWMKSKDVQRRSCGYGLLYEVSKWKKKSAPDDAFFLARIGQIGKTFATEKRGVHMAMGLALMGMGKRNAKLNRAALKVARAIGPIRFGEEGAYEPFDVVKHLTQDRLKKALGV